MRTQDNRNRAATPLPQPEYGTDSSPLDQYSLAQASSPLNPEQQEQLALYYNKNPNEGTKY